MAKIVILLQDNERDALVTLAEREFRDPRIQARLIIMRELERAGLLQINRLPIVSNDKSNQEVANVGSSNS